MNRDEAVKMAQQLTKETGVFHCPVRDHGKLEPSDWHIENVDGEIINIGRKAGAFKKVECECPSCHRKDVAIVECFDDEGVHECPNCDASFNFELEE